MAFPAARSSVKKLRYPLSRFLFLVLPNDGPLPALQQFRRLDADKPDRREDHREGRAPCRCPAVTGQEEEVEGKLATEAYLLDHEEEYLAAEEIPRCSDRRAELMLGALVVAVVGLLVAMIVFVFVRGWPSFAHNGLSWFSAGGQRRQPAADDLPVG